MVQLWKLLMAKVESLRTHADSMKHGDPPVPIVDGLSLRKKCWALDMTNPFLPILEGFRLDGGACPPTAHPTFSCEFNGGQGMCQAVGLLSATVLCPPRYGGMGGELAPRYGRAQEMPMRTLVYAPMQVPQLPPPQPPAPPAVAPAPPQQAPFSVPWNMTEARHLVAQNLCEISNPNTSPLPPQVALDMRIADAKRLAGLYATGQQVKPDYRLHTRPAAANFFTTEPLHNQQQRGYKEYCKIGSYHKA